MSALGCLIAARALLVCGWARRGMSLDRDGLDVFALHDERAIAWSISGAIATAECETQLDRVHASQLIRRLIPTDSIPTWNDHPLRRKREVLYVMDRAISLAKGLPDAPRKPRGWRVTTGPAQSVDVVPITASLGERRPPKRAPEPKQLELFPASKKPKRHG